ncbi:uncharacterized protein LOC114365030 [Ostrinia furnacalis]|uniref:uncharacterized protein LOC114365030 n=1 Tax=Ostrinia furnacalis TaxID=93504 RepID=UPI00103D12E6|nr:uncharacterized protein LOC114365030 [Ostrinia furnacalis]
MTLLKIMLLQVILVGLFIRTKQSITGVTYMDHFDFEERYRNVYECDPLHWYPLHLPPECTKMYEELIRKGVASMTNTPVKILKERESAFYNLNPYALSSSVPLYEPPDSQESEEVYKYDIPRLPPYVKMFDMLRKDVRREPKAPVVTNLPGLGAVALYRQPISRKSGQYIKKIAGVYRDAYMKHYPYYNNTTNNDTETTTEQHETSEVDENEPPVHKHKLNIKKKIKNGNSFAILRTYQN